MKKILYASTAAALFASGWLTGTITRIIPAPSCPYDMHFNMDNQLDSSFTVADGKVEVFYPSDGLYELGAELEYLKDDDTETVIISAEQDILRNKPQLSRAATSLLAKSTFVPDDFDIHKYADERPESYFEEGGFRYIKDHEMYVASAKEDHSSWTALLTHNNHLIEINMRQNQLMGDPLSMAAWANNDLLFDKILNEMRLHN